MCRLDVAAPADVETPAHLMSEEEVEALVRERQPAFVPLAGPGTEGEDWERVEEETGGD